MSFWTYQTHQETSFQTALLKNANEKNAQISKQLENVIREANSEIDLRTNKISMLERELELERKKTRDLSDASREKDREYQKLKNHYDNIKRKALLAPSTLQQSTGDDASGGIELIDNPPGVARVRNLGPNIGNGVSMGDVVNGMEANRIQRTPIRPAAGGGFNNAQQHVGGTSHWQPQRHNQSQQQQQQRRSFAAQGAQPGNLDAFAYTTGNNANPLRRSGGAGSGASNSEEIIEEILCSGGPGASANNPPPYRAGMASRTGSSHAYYAGQPAGSGGSARSLAAAGLPAGVRRVAPVLAQPAARRSTGGFRPAPFTGR